MMKKTPEPSDSEAVKAPLVAENGIENSSLGGESIEVEVELLSADRVTDVASVAMHGKSGGAKGDRSDKRRLAETNEVKVSDSDSDSGSDSDSEDELGLLPTAAEMSSALSTGIQDGGESEEGPNATIDVLEVDLQEQVGDGRVEDDGKEEEEMQRGQTFAINDLTENVAGRDIVVNNTQVIDDGDGGTFLPLAIEEWELVKRLFVPSETCQAFCLDVVEGRLLLVLGPEGSGKRATALYLASRLGFLSLEHSEVLTYRPVQHSREVSLQDLVNHKNFCSGSLLLFEDAFEVGLSDIEVNSIHSLQAQLAERKAFIILTSELHTRDVPHNIPRVFSHLNAAQLREVLKVSLGQELRSEMAYRREDIESWIDKSWSSLVGILDAPFKVHRFCRRLAHFLSEEPGLEAGKLEQLAQEAIDPGPQQLRRWFRDLGANGQLLAFLVVFFPDLIKSDLLSLYLNVVQWFREVDPTLYRDSRHQGFEDMLEALQAQTRDQVVLMEAAHYQLEVRRQVSNHILTLRSVVDLILGNLLQVQGHEMWPLRKGVGQLIGYLGLLDEGWRDVTIDRLAQSKNRQFCTIASYALAPIVAADQERRSKKVIVILRRWCEADNADMLWTAGSGILQAYRRLMSEKVESTHQSHRERLKEELLRRLQALNDKRQSNPWFPMVQLLRSFSEEIAPRLIPWMVRDKAWRDLVLKAVEEFLKNPMAARISALPQLLGGLLASASPEGDRSKRIFENFREWTFREDLADGVLSSLLEIAHRGEERQRLRLRQALSRSWHGFPGPEEIASQVVARTWALDGRWSRLPSRALCLLVLDPRGGSQAYGEIRRHLQLVLSSRLMLQVAYLGDAGGGASASFLQSRRGIDKTRGRLLMPLIEEFPTAEIRKVVVLAAGPILDIEDLTALTEPEVLLLALGGESLLSQEEAERFPGLSVHLREHAEEFNIRKVEQALERVLARVEDASRDEGGVLLDLTPPEAGALVGLSDPKSAAGPRDLLGRLCAGFVCESERNLEGALSILAEWFSRGQCATEEDSVIREESINEILLAAKTMARSLLHSSIRDFHRRKIFPSTRLFTGVVEVLAKEDPKSAALILEFLEICLDDPDWAIYLAGDVISGRGRLLRFVHESLPDRLPPLANLIAKHSLDELESLQAQFAELVSGVVPKETLPELQEGQKRALIFVDNEAGELLWPAALGIANGLLEPGQNLNIVPSLFQLGAEAPAWIPGSPWKPSTTPTLPSRLVGAALENPDLRTGDTAFILILARGDIVDQEDWLESSWAEKVWVYSMLSGASPPNLGGVEVFQRLVAVPARKPRELAGNILQALAEQPLENELAVAQRVVTNG